MPERDWLRVSVRVKLNSRRRRNVKAVFGFGKIENTGINSLMIVASGKEGGWTANFDVMCV